jgi:hypothetical protein
MISKSITEELEVAFEFIRIAHERGGYMDCGEEQSGVPALEGLVLFPLQYTHLPEPKTVMMQMWRAERSITFRAYRVGESPFNIDWSKVGEPFEFTYQEEDE